MKLFKVFCWNRAGRLVVAGEAHFEFRSHSYGTKNSRSPADTMLSAQVSKKTLNNFHYKLKQKSTTFFSRTRRRPNEKELLFPINGHILLMPRHGFVCSKHHQRALPSIRHPKQHCNKMADRCAHLHPGMVRHQPF